LYFPKQKLIIIM